MFVYVHTRTSDRTTALTGLVVEHDPSTLGLTNVRNIQVTCAGETFTSSNAAYLNPGTCASNTASTVSSGIVQATAPGLFTGYQSGNEQNSCFAVANLFATDPFSGEGISACSHINGAFCNTAFVCMIQFTNKLLQIMKDVVLSCLTMLDLLFVKMYVL